MRVQILLSTYNGEAYLAQQLDSLLAQDYPEVEILVRDDGSTDGTLTVLRRYAACSRRIRVFAGENLGYARSFMTLLQEASPTAGYYAFCDQDDVWRGDKISRAVAALGEVDGDIPALYCTRLAVADAELRPLGHSAVPRKGLTFRNALVECSTPGCSCVINPPARNLLIPPPQWLDAHDGWTYLVISAFGRILYDETPTLLYRRHAATVTPYSIGSVRRWRARLGRCLAREQRGFLQQARELQRIHGDRLPEESRLVLARFLERRPGYGTRLRYALAGDVYRQGALDHLILKALILADGL